MMQHSSTTREINNKLEMQDLTSGEKCILPDSAGLLTLAQVVQWQVLKGDYYGSRSMETMLTTS